MSAIAEYLAEQLNHEDDFTIDRRVLNRNIDFLDRIDSRFCNIAAGLITGAHPTVRTLLEGFLKSERRINEEIARAKALRNKFNIDCNAATLILEYLIRTKSVTRLDIADDEATNYSLRLSVHSGDRLILNTNPYLRPVMLEASDDAVNRYCHPLAVASHVLEARYGSQPFLTEAPAFIAWASVQPDLKTVLQLALVNRTVRPETLTDLMILRELDALMAPAAQEFSFAH